MFFSFFGTFDRKVAQTWFILHGTWHRILFDIYYCVEVFRFENHTHILETRVKLQFYAFLSFCGTFAPKITQTWCVLHENWHTTLFGIYYCVEEGIF